MSTPDWINYTRSYADEPVGTGGVFESVIERCCSLLRFDESPRQLNIKRLAPAPRSPSQPTPAHLAISAALSAFLSISCH